MTGTVLLVDTPNMYAANASKLGHLRRSDGKSTGGVFGTIRMVEATVERFTPRIVFMTYEDGGASVRRSIDPAYKSDRVDGGFWVPGWEHDLARYAAGRGFVTLSMSGCEADDVIAAVVKDTRRRALDDYIVILSRDHDFKKLLDDDRVGIVAASKEPTYDRNDFLEEHGFPPEWYHAYCALAGDVSDNVRGCVSARDAKKILQDANGEIDTIRIILRQEAWDDDELEIFERNLGVIGFIDVEMGDIYDGSPEPDRDLLLGLYRENEFNSLIKKLETSS